MTSVVYFLHPESNAVPSNVECMQLFWSLSYLANDQVSVVSFFNFLGFLLHCWVLLFGRFHISSASDVIRCAGLRRFVQFEGVITGLSQPQKYTQVFYLLTSVCSFIRLFLIKYFLQPLIREQVISRKA